MTVRKGFHTIPGQKGNLTHSNIFVKKLQGAKFISYWFEVHTCKQHNCFYSPSNLKQDFSENGLTIKSLKLPLKWV